MQKSLDLWNFCFKTVRSTLAVSITAGQVRAASERPWEQCRTRLSELRPKSARTRSKISAKSRFQACFWTALETAFWRGFSELQQVQSANELGTGRLLVLANALHHIKHASYLVSLFVNDCIGVWCGDRFGV